MFDESDYAHEMFNQFIEETFNMPSITPVKFVPAGPARLSYVQLFEPAVGPDPSQDAVRSVSLLFPKNDTACIQSIATQLTLITNSVVANIPEITEATQLRTPVRDGDAEIKANNRGDEYAGMLFMNAKSWRPIGIVDGQNLPIIDPDELYSGCWANVQISFKYYNTKGNKGIRVEINLVQKVRDDDRFDGVDKAEDIFAVTDIPADSGGATISMPGMPVAQPGSVAASNEKPEAAAPAAAANPFANLV